MLQEELNALVQIYERRGFFDEVLTLLEAGLSLERAHVCLQVYHTQCLLTTFLADGYLHRDFDSLQQIQAREMWVSCLFGGELLD